MLGAQKLAPALVHVETDRRHQSRIDRSRLRIVGEVDLGGEHDRTVAEDLDVDMPRSRLVVAGIDGVERPGSSFTLRGLTVPLKAGVSISDGGILRMQVDPLA